jgi:uncharacterized protein YutE (UPF0331/DUF86 family)
VQVDNYSDIGIEVNQGRGIDLSKNDVDILIMMAGYRNHLVNFNHEVSSEGLYDTCKIRLGEFENWMKGIPDLTDSSK